MRSDIGNFLTQIYEVGYAEGYRDGTHGVTSMPSTDIADIFDVLLKRDVKIPMHPDQMPLNLPNANTGD